MNEHGSRYVISGTAISWSLACAGATVCKRKKLVKRATRETFQRMLRNRVPEPYVINHIETTRHTARDAWADRIDDE